MAPGKTKADGLKRPARLSGALADWVEEAKRQGSDGVKRPARLIAGLAEWVGARDSRELESAFRGVGLEVHESKPDHHYVHEYYGRGARKLRSGLDDEEFFPLAQEVWEQGRTYLYYNRLYALYQAVRNVVRRFPREELRFVEAGVYQGGSAYFLGRVAERYAPDRVSLVAVDTFEGHSEKDLPTGGEGAHTFEKFKETSVDDVREYLAPLSFAKVVQGRFQDVAPGLEGEFQLVHADLDIYAPTRFTLGFASERVPPGGIVIVDDYGFTTCPGVKRAVDEFVEEQAHDFALHRLDSGQALLVRTR